MGESVPQLSFQREEVGSTSRRTVARRVARVPRNVRIVQRQPGQ